ncbi:HD-GYP domain-containing protein [Pseudomonadota bacterium]
MIKKVASNRLMVGMFIHDLDASWLTHPFLTSSFAINNAAMVRKIIDARIKHVYIDTEKGIDLPEATPKVEVERQVFKEKQLVASKQKGLSKKVPYEQEIYHARKILREAHNQMRNVMNDARIGQRIDEAVVEEMVDNVIDSIFRNQDALIHLSRIKQRDQYTYQHAISTCVLMASFAKALSLEKEKVRQIGIGAMLHDLGKMRVPLDILNKPGKLTGDEYQLMKDHVDLGCELLDNLGGITPTVLNVAKQHHERIDGSGYPLRLMGERISQEGQMAAIVDVYDALTSDRCYKKAWEPTFTLGKMLEWGNDHFGQNLVHQFVRCVGIYPVGTLVRLDSNMVAVVVDQNENDLLLPIVRIVFDEARKRYIQPKDVDLSHHPDELQIIEAIAPSDVSIDPQAFV